MIRKLLFLLFYMSSHLYSAEVLFKKRLESLIKEQQSSLLLTLYYAGYGHHHDGIIHKPDETTETLLPEQVEFIRENLEIDFYLLGKMPSFKLKKD